MSDDQCVIATTDFLMLIVDDPHIADSRGDQCDQSAVLMLFAGSD